jgi:hypothetical protein
VQGPTDTSKIFTLGKRAGFIIIGASGLSAYKRGKLTRVYSLAGSVHKFYTNHPFQDDDPGWNALTQFLKKDFETTYQRNQKAIEVSPGASDDVVWEIDFLYLSNGNPVIEQILYHLDGTTELKTLPKKPYISGQTDVALSVLRPGQVPDARFSDLRGLHEIGLVWHDAAPEYPMNVTVHDALVFAHTFIRASSERMHLLNSGPELVGPTCDCVLMKKYSGIQWLQRAVDTRTAGLALPK